MERENQRKFVIDKFKEFFDLPDTIQESNTMGACMHQFIDFALSIHVELTRIPTPDEKSVETLLEEQHRNTLNDSVEIVDLWFRTFMYEHSAITDQLSGLFDYISHDIHNLKQRKP